MLTEEGQVISVQGTEALVRTQRTEACHACKAKGACDAMGGSKDVEMVVLNYIRAKSGDRVELALPESSLLKASIITYALPMAALMIGAVAGQLFASALGWSADTASIVLGAIGLGLSILAVMGLNRMVSGREHYIPRIIRVLPPLAAPGGKVEGQVC